MEKFKNTIIAIAILPIISGLMLNPDWIIDNCVEPAMFMLAGYLLYKLVSKKGK